MTDRLLRVPEIAAMTGKPVATIRWYRHLQTAGHDDGPRMFKLGRAVVAKESDVAAWIEREYAASGGGRVAWSNQDGRDPHRMPVVQPADRRTRPIHQGGPMSAQDREALADVLIEHRLVGVTGGTATGSRWICQCSAQEINPGTRDHAEAQHVRHVVARITLALAERDRRVRAEALRAARDDIRDRIRVFRDLNADPEYLNALNDAWGLVANRERADQIEGAS